MFTQLRIGLKRAQKNNKTRLRFTLIRSGLFKNVTFAVVVRPHFLNVVGRKRSGTWRCVNTVAVNISLHFILIMFGGKTSFWVGNFLFYAEGKQQIEIQTEQRKRNQIMPSLFRSGVL